MPFLISDTLQIEILRVVEKNTSGELSQKAQSIREDIVYKTEDSDVSVRSEEYGRSLDEFIASPIVGTNNSDSLGNHSAVFDRLGALGIIGIFPYIMFIVAVVKHCLKRLPLHIDKWYYVICLICFITTILLKDMNKLEIWFAICVVAPALLTVSGKKKTYNTNNNLF